MNRTSESIIVGIGDMGVSKDPDGIVKTLALGSCIGIALLDPRTRTIGLVHIALPDSKTDLQRAKTQPCYFADTGLDQILHAMNRTAGGIEPRRLMVKIAGGAQVADPNSHFNVGKRNALAVKRLLWQKGMVVLSEDIGGTISRTVTVSCATGRVTISTPGIEDRYI